MANTIKGDDDNNFINGTSSDDALIGLGGDDTLRGLDGDDMLNGGTGNDDLTGGAGFDELKGGDGNDILQGGGGATVHLSADHPSDLIEGGTGTDTMIVNYANFVLESPGNPPAAVTLDISTGTGVAIVSTLQGEGFSSIEVLDFSGPDGDDHVTGGANRDRIDGAGGDDVLKGGGGNDQISDSFGIVNANGGAGTDDFVLNRTGPNGDTGNEEIHAADGSFTVDGAFEGTFVNFENLVVFAGSGNDVITGFDQGINDLQGFGGNDTLTGGAKADDLQGGDGSDMLNGGGGDDTIKTGDGNDIASGGAGNDALVGGVGNDNLQGGAGDDSVSVFLPGGNASAGSNFGGGAGNDTFIVGFGSQAVINLTNTAIHDFEAMTDSGFSAVVNYVVKMTTLQFAQFSSISFFASDMAAIQLTDNAAAALPANASFHTLMLADGGQVFDASTMVGGFAAIVGGNGNDTLTGGDRAGSFFDANLGKGDDRFIGKGSFDRILGGTGDDTLNGGLNNDTLTGDAGRDTLSGGVGNDRLTGGADADHLNGGDGIDVLAYTTTSDSTGPAFDTIAGFDFSVDKFDLPFAVASIGSAVAGGSLSKRTFDANLAAVVDAGRLDVHQAVLYTPNDGDFSGKTFLVVDANGTAGYQPGADYVFLLTGATHLDQLGTTDFI